MYAPEDYCNRSVCECVCQSFSLATFFGDIIYLYVVMLRVNFALCSLDVYMYVYCGKLCSQVMASFTCTSTFTCAIAASFCLTLR